MKNLAYKYSLTSLLFSVLILTYSLDYRILTFHLSYPFEKELKNRFMFCFYKCCAIGCPCEYSLSAVVEAQ